MRRIAIFLLCCYMACSTLALLWLTVHLLLGPDVITAIRDYQKRIQRLDYRKGQFEVVIPGANAALIWPQPVEHLSSQLAIAKIKRIHFEPFRILIEPRVCTARLKLSLMIYVSTTPKQADIETRNAIRKTWGKEALEKYNIPVVFVVGRDIRESLDPSADIRVMLAENEKHGDILMANFEDSWDHLIHKWWLVMHYHSDHCNDIELLMYADSDTVFFPDNLMRFHKNLLTQSDDTLACFIIRHQPVERGEASRYFIAKHQWPDDRLPQYCSGVLEMVNAKTAGRLSRGLVHLGLDYVLSFKIFDVLTGVIANASGVYLRQLPGLYPWLPILDLCREEMFALHGIKSATLIQALIEYRSRCCLASFQTEEMAKRRTCPFNGTIPVI